MKQILLLLFFFSLIGCTEDKPINGLTQYQKLKGVSNFAQELGIEGNTFKGSFSDDYNTFYFFRKISPGVEKYIPYISHFENGTWQEPQIAGYYDEKHSYTYQLKVPGTNELYFISNQRTKNDTSATPNYNFWKTEHIDGEFSTPEEFEYNSLIYNYNSQPCITHDGTLHFTSDTPDWSQTLSYTMKPGDSGYSEPELHWLVNDWRENKEWTVFEFCVSPKEDYIIVCIEYERDQIPSSDLYISRLRDGVWTFPKKLGWEINTNKTENFPYITPDGKYLLFTRDFSEFKIVPIKKVLDY